MPDVICNTSPLQYLHQLGHLHLLPSMVERVITPPAVVAELAEGMSRGVNLPVVEKLDWIIVRRPVSMTALPLVHDLGAGETEALALALESHDAIVIIDDALARREAEILGQRFIGTLGVLMSAKKAGLIPAVAPLIDQLQELNFRIANHTRDAVLRLTGEKL